MIKRTWWYVFGKEWTIYDVKVQIIGLSITPGWIFTATVHQKWFARWFAKWTDHKLLLHSPGVDISHGDKWKTSCWWKESYHHCINWLHKLMTWQVFCSHTDEVLFYSCLFDNGICHTSIFLSESIVCNVINSSFQRVVWGWGMKCLSVQTNPLSVQTWICSSNHHKIHRIHMFLTPLCIVLMFQYLTNSLFMVLISLATRQWKVFSHTPPGESYKLILVRWLM